MTPWQHVKRMGMLVVAAGRSWAGLSRIASPRSPTASATFSRPSGSITEDGRGAWRGVSITRCTRWESPSRITCSAVIHRPHGNARRLALACACVIVLVIPVYLLALELFGERAAWVACLLMTVNPVVDDIVVNVLSESTFLVWWTFGLWCTVRFLRGGKFGWLPAAIGLGGLAYLTRPEGMLLAAALAGTVVISPLFRATRIDWRRWRWAVAFLAAGPAIVIGPYVALKGGVGTKPGIARVLGLAPRAEPLALERGKPVPAGQSMYQTYHLATIRMIKAFRVGVTAPLFPLALFGLVLAMGRPDRARAGLLLAIILAASAFALVRLHATGGYCTARHGLIPGMLLTLAAAHAITWLMEKIAIPGRWLGLVREWVRPGPICRAAVVGALVFASLKIQDLGPFNHGPYSVYQATGEWLSCHTGNHEHVLDLTGWPLFFSSLHGYSFANVYEAPADPATRWIVVRQPHVDGHWYYSEVIRDLIGGRAPVAQVPPRAAANQVQILIYDRLAPPARMTVRR